MKKYCKFFFRIIGKEKKIKTTLIYMIIVLVTFNTFSLYGTTHYQMKKFINEYLANYTLQIVSSANEQFNTCMKDVTNFIIRAANSKQLNSFIKHDNLAHTTEKENYQKKKNLEKIIGELFPNWNYISFLGIEYNEHSYYFGSTGKPEIYNDFFYSLNNALEDIYSDSNTIHVENLQILNQNYATLIHPIFDTDTNKLCFVLILGLNIKNFNLGSSDKTIDQLGTISILDSSNNIIYPMTNSSNSAIKNNILSKNNISKNQIVKIKTNFMDWSIVGNIPLNVVTNEIRQQQIYTIILTVLITIISIMFAVLISNRITNPLFQIVTGMEEIENNNYQITPLNTVFSEINFISDQFQHMCEYLNRLINDVYIAEIHEKEAQFAVLQSQINPHFLYNTLDSLYMMLIMKNEQELSDYVLNLSNLFRYSLHHNSSSTTLGDEFKFINEYLSIHKMRLGQRLTYEIHMEPELSNYTIIRFLIQPIVENAVIHGINPMPAGGKLILKAYHQKKYVFICIEDNGIGIDVKKIENLLQSETIGDTSQIGIRNVNSRIKHYYGKDYGIYFSKKKKGTSVLIALPQNTCE